MFPLDPLEFQLAGLVKKIEEHHAQKRILLSVLLSGGLDSMCLLEAMCCVLQSKKVSWNNTYVLLAHHVDHGLRGQESQGDGRFVVDVCLQKGVPVVVDKWSPKEEKIKNLQNTLRVFRKEVAYKRAQNITTSWRCDGFFLLTAHHARDHVETVLMHMLRGCGLAGLQGLPLLDVEKRRFCPFSSIAYEDILAYQKRKNVQYREDSSNQSDKYTRNYLRHHVLPHFKKIQWDYQDKFRRLSDVVCCFLEEQRNKEKNSVLLVDSTTKSSHIYGFLEKLLPMGILTQNTSTNILQECKNLWKKGVPGQNPKIIALQHGYKVLLSEQGDRRIVLTLAKGEMDVRGNLTDGW